MTKLIITFCLLAANSTGADVINSVRAARWSLHLYAATQTFVGCLWWHNSKFHILRSPPPNDVARLAEDALSYPFVFLLAPPYLDAFVMRAVDEVQKNARAGDFDLNHSKTLLEIEYLINVDPTVQCESAAENFRRTLRKYLEVESSLN